MRSLGSYLTALFSCAVVGNNSLAQSSEAYNEEQIGSGDSYMCGQT